jgi:hypothetical protein
LGDYVSGGNYVVESSALISLTSLSFIPLFFSHEIINESSLANKEDDEDDKEEKNEIIIISISSRSLEDKLFKFQIHSTHKFNSSNVKMSLLLQKKNSDDEKRSFLLIPYFHHLHLNQNNNNNKYNKETEKEKMFHKPTTQNE